MPNYDKWIRRKALYVRYTLFCRTISDCESDADTDKILWVDPHEIKYESRSSAGSVLNRPGLVLGGFWDKNLNLFENQIQYKSIKNHFLNDVPWENTIYFQKRIKGELGTINSEEKVREYMGMIDDLYCNIKEDGYIPANQIKDEWISNKREIGINIGRDGELIWHYDGRHRLSIAKILNIDKVAVRVLARHKKWQNLRDKIRSSEYSNDLSDAEKSYLDHPDLKDISFKFS